MTFTLTTPEGWEALETEHPDTTVIAAGDTSGPFRANLVVSAYPWEGTIAELSLAAIHRDLEPAPGLATRTLDVAEVEWGGHTGRYHRAAYPVDGVTIMVDRMLLLSGTTALEAVVSATLRDEQFEPHMLQKLLEHLTWDAPVEPEPADAYEDLASLPQPGLSGGWAVHAPAAEALRAMSLFRPEPISDPEIRADLTSAGVLDDRGQITEEVLEALAILKDPVVNLVGTLRHGDRISHFEAAATTQGVTVASGPSLAHMQSNPVNSGPEAWWIRRCNHGDFPLVLGDWLGLLPAWGVPTTITDLPADVLGRRMVEGPSLTPPDSLDDDGRAAWSEPWSVWELAFEEEPSMRVAAIRVGEWGYIRTDTGSDGEPRSSRPGDIWSTLAALWTIQLDNELGPAPDEDDESD